MNDLKEVGNIQSIKTAYGIKQLNAINYIDRSELVSEINSGLSIRGKNPIEFYNKLKELLKEYGTEVTNSKLGSS